MKWLYFLVLPMVFFMCTHNANAQKTSIERRDFNMDNLAFLRTHYAVNFTYNICRPAMVTRITGKETLHANAQTGFEGTFTWMQNINEKWGIRMGIGAGVVGNTYIIAIPYRDLGNPEPSEDLFINNGAAARDRSLVYFSFPITLERRKYIGNGFFLAASAGLGIRYFPSNDVENGGPLGYVLNNRFVQTGLFSVTMDGSNNGKPWLNLLLEPCLYKQFKYGDMVKVSLAANVSLRDFARGNYQFQIDGQPSTFGSYRVDGTSIGLKVSYVYTQAWKVMREIKR
ncbi:MAG: hypothetical protein ACRDE2_11940 [Chitinophagaceae bacterium]